MKEIPILENEYTFISVITVTCGWIVLFNFIVCAKWVHIVYFLRFDTRYLESCIRFFSFFCSIYS